jgi:hypothetical protein
MVSTGRAFQCTDSCIGCITQVAWHFWRQPDGISLGAVGRLFWDPRAIRHLGPLHHADAGDLFDLAADHFRLRDLDLAEFRDKALESAEGNPGQIIEMCRMASNPIYVAASTLSLRRCGLTL